MPYYITDKSDDCPSWAVVKEDGELLACHDSKDSAIEQAIAVSLSEDVEFGGERAAVGSLASGDWVSWDANNPEIVAQVVVVEDQYAVVRVFEYEYGVFSPTDKLMVINVLSIDKVQRPERIAVEEEELPEPEDDMDETDDDIAPGEQFTSRVSPNDLEGRAVNQTAPAYMRAAARRGLELYDDGFGGAGLTQKTIREARLMAEGQVSDDKWIRIAAWIARHMPDLDAPKNSNRQDPEYPGPGLVAHLLWGSGPSKRAAERAMNYAEGVVARIRAEERTMTDTTEKMNRWADVARAIQKKIDGVTPSKDPEIRTTNTSFELRSEEGDGMTFTGYASVFNSSSEDLGGFREFVAPGAFKRSLQARNEIKLLWNHDTSEPLASVRGGSLQLVEDSHGLKVTAKLPNTTRGRDVAELLRSKVIDSMSFGFNVIKDSWSNNGAVRTLESVRLSEVSVVTYPAYTATSASVRSAQPTIDADELANALLKLESGEDLDEKSASLITDVVGKLRQQPEAEVETDDNGLALLDLKKKQLDLLLKRI